MRYTHRDMPRVFRVPFGSWFVPTVGSLLCILVMIGTSKATAYRFLVWTGIGQIIYFSYSFRHSKGRSMLQQHVINTPGAVRPILKTVAENSTHADIELNVISEISNGHDEDVIEQYF